jgi:hypothetical protein
MLIECQALDDVRRTSLQDNVLGGYHNVYAAFGARRLRLVPADSLDKGGHAERPSWARGDTMGARQAEWSAVVAGSES